ncbi:hypothetical protein GCM10023333_27450 [Ferrimonas pelagia]|uniref:LRAT domain-containing protein n=1 Tax=Ferrimonas pelagia TaxID=1177826 RepID=A0ABP9F352_9GAMM
MPVPGAVVVCHVFGVVEHTGIWLGSNAIAELHGSGLVRAVSPKRFLHGRSGARIFVCCDRLHAPLIQQDAVQRAVASLFTYRDYHLRHNNCHRFIWHCLTGQEQKITSFSQFNLLLSQLFDTGLYWDPCELLEASGGPME